MPSATRPLALRERPRVLLYADGSKTHVRAFCTEITAWLESRARLVGTVWRQDTVNLDPQWMKKRPDLLIVLGGDGSLLGASRAFGSKEWPTLGINLGRLGFLSAADRSNWQAVLTSVFEGEAVIQRRTRIEWSIKPGSTPRSPSKRAKAVPPQSGVALNEVLVSRSSRDGLIVVGLELELKPISDYRGDGLLISTPTGSTAYSLAAGGPLLDPTLEAFSVTPICPHQLTQRPLVVPAHLAIGLRLIEGDRATLSVDGQNWLPLRPGDAVHLRAARIPFHWVALPGRGFYHRLRTSLGWGLGARRESQSPRVD